MSSRRVWAAPSPFGSGRALLRGEVSRAPSRHARRASSRLVYATLAHETTHATRHKSRLDREFGQKRWGDEGYAMEELVAELGAAFLPCDLSLTPEVREDHASYLASWIKVSKSDKRAIFSAASHAQLAVDFLHGLQPKPTAVQAEAA
jgi:antirestriction protein ArdC